jgi:hypothetical protein
MDEQFSESLPNEYYDMTAESWNSEVRKKRSLLGNDSLNTFSRQRIRKQQSSTHAFPTRERECFLNGPCKVII